MDGWVDGGEKEEAEEGSALAPWNVASPCKIFSLCFNYCVAASKHFKCLTEENARHSFSDVNEPCMPTRSHFASPVYSIHLQWCGCYYNVLKIYLFLVQNSHKDICFFTSLSKLDQFQDQVTLILSSSFFMDESDWDHVSPFCPLIINKTSVYGHAMLDCQRHVYQTVNTQRPPLEVRNDSKWLRMTQNNSSRSKSRWMNQTDLQEAEKSIYTPTNLKNLKA